MKIEPLKPKPEFNPLVLTLETPEEVAALFALVNHCAVAAAVGLSVEDGGWYDQIRAANNAAGNGNIAYSQLHRNLEAILKK